MVGRGDIKAELTLTTPLEAPVLVANAAVEVHLGIDVLAVLAGDAAAQPAALVDVDGGGLGGVVEVGHVGCCRVVTSGGGGVLGCV